MPSDPAPLLILRPPGREPYAVSLDQLTALVRAARTLRRMAFLDKLKQAGQVVMKLQDAAERDADTIIARGEELDAKRAAATIKHHRHLDATHDALDGFDHALDDYVGNGAPRSGEGSDEHRTPYDGTNGEQVK